MPVPATGRDLHVDQPLSNLVIGRRPEGFIADQILPVTPVSKQSDLYYKFNHGFNRMYQPNLSRRAPGTEAKKVHMTVSSDTYYASNYELGTDWPVEDVVNADEQLQWAESNAIMLTDRLLMDFEVRVADLAVASANVASVTLVDTIWTNQTGARVLSDIQTNIERLRVIAGVSPNLMIIPRKVWTHLSMNDQIIDKLFGDRGGIASPEQVGQIFGCRVLVPGAQVNTFGEQETQNGSWAMADVWGNNVWIAKVNLLAGRYTDTWLNAFRWTSPLLGTPWAVQRHPFDTKRKAYDISVGYYQAEKVISPDLAIRICSVVPA